MTTPVTRIAWLDQVRAAGILLVVIGHAIRSAGRTGLDVPPAFHVADMAIYSFHMPLFFLLAGMTHALGGPRSPARALEATAKTIVLPYLLWSSIWIGLKHGFAAEANQAVEGTWLSILWQPVDHFWFLYVLFLIRLVWIAVDATGSRLLRRAAILLPLVVAFVGAGPSSGVLSPFLLFWAAFYGLGMVLLDGLRATPRPALAGIALAAEILWIGLLLLAPGLMDDGFGLARSLAALAGSLALIGAVAIAAPGGLAGRLIGFAGEASLTIFLTHTLFGAAARVVLNRLGLLTPEILLVAATAAGIVGPMLLHAAVLKAGLATGRPLGLWFGLGGQRRSAYLDLSPRAKPASAVSLGGPSA